MNSADIKRNIDERIERITRVNEANPPKLHELKEEMEEIDALKEAYFDAVEKERRSARRDFYSYRKHGFKKVFYRSLNRNSPQLNPMFIILIIFAFIVAVARGFINA